MDSVSSNSQVEIPGNDSSVSETSDDSDPLCTNVNHSNQTVVSSIAESRLHQTIWHTIRGFQVLTFTCNTIAIVPLSALLTDATEVIAAKAGDTIGALLNITFGNLVELILFV
ncbi:hypothetical protein BFJ63_vAg12669 [Fusarium oxysporum f. sp. narcissi]|uniref:Sodium/calcium exchanger membrane region domain-containing protein n=1 Tax=Fusarium oxysporum f. sp. narcissi TaxID=451672 RepID=A0A4Q2VCH8_FUSOX|nr:hypothetical protein BFJ67_g15446 [Fusarium oxysporum f. sp. cepae]RKK34041.1 hypothetical protein BFJ66_g14609 [Fusarium oxysporum f. sp. cepae]RYC84460.1 hypothetical protein BFJ63_vAg12669 [Fusarium oxysporum f. sp. narcissi]